MLNLRKGIIINRYKQVRKTLGTVDYQLNNDSFKNTKLNLTEYYELKKEKTKKTKKPKKEKRTIKVDKPSNDKDNSLLSELSLVDEGKINQKAKKESDVEVKKDESKNVFSVEEQQSEEQQPEDQQPEEPESPIESPINQDIIDSVLSDETKSSNKEESFNENLQEIIDKPVDSDKKKVIVTNWTPDKDKEMFQM